MPKRSRPLPKDWSRVTRFKMALVTRDPEGKRLLGLCRAGAELVKQWGPRPRKQQLDDYANWLSALPPDYNDQLNALHAKYGIRPTDNPQSILEVSAPATWGTNFGYPPQMAVSLDVQGQMKRIPWRPSPTPVLLSRTDPPTLGVAVYLTEITKKDLERLARWFKARVRECLNALPKGRVAALVPELEFLRTVTERQFFKDLRRYDLHMERKLSFRKIAVCEKAIEDAKKRGRALTVDDCLKEMPGSVSGRPQRESSVRASVHRIFEAIYRRRYQATRPQMDTAGLSLTVRRRIPLEGRQIGKIRPSGWEKSTT